MLWGNPGQTNIKLGYNAPTAADDQQGYSLVLDAGCAAGYTNCLIPALGSATKIRPLRSLDKAAPPDAAVVYWSPSTFELIADYTPPPSSETSAAQSDRRTGSALTTPLRHLDPRGKF
jgi:hypothetical protein